MKFLILITLSLFLSFYFLRVYQRCTRVLLYRKIKSLFIYSWVDPNSVMGINDFSKDISTRISIATPDYYQALTAYENTLISDCISNSEPFVLYLMFSLALFCIGFFGIFFNRSNLIKFMMCLEIMFLGLSLSFIITSICIYDPTGQVYGILLITVAAAEAAVGLGLLIAGFRLKRDIQFQSFTVLRN